ncbi:MAG TPA: proteasome subunit alpha [Acidimicrobiales bacterium]|jgi:proteasome alpha subunit
MPFYVSPEQVMNDKAQYARKGIARGRSLVSMVYDEGILLAAENPSEVLHKISEIYDRIAFAGAGKYSEYDSLRRQGVQFADVRGYQYSREDVDARSLANAYAQVMNHVFTTEIKPLEVEILVAEVGHTAETDQLFRITFDGIVVDDEHYSVLGGESEPVAERLKESWQANLTLGDALRTARAALAGPERTIEASSLEVAVLSRTNGRRAFGRIDGEPLAELLGP